LFYIIGNVQGAKPYFARAFAIISDLLGAWARILAVIESTTGWWLQLDFDVLSTNSFPAVDFPHPGGLNWEQLDRLTTAGFTTDNNVDGM
jgi:arginase family enzyme